MRTEASTTGWKVAIFVGALLGIQGCSCGRDLRVSGESGYVRCYLADPPEARTWSVGEARWTLDGRTLSASGLPDEVRLSAFTDARSSGEAIDALRAFEPHLMFFVGGAGFDPDTATRTFESLAGLGVPVVFVPGGEDSHAVYREVLAEISPEARELVVDASGLRLIRVGSTEWVPLAGGAAEAVQSEEACGFSEADVDALDDVPSRDAERVRYLLSWYAPRLGGERSFARGLMGIEVGSAAVAGFADRVEAQGGLYGWPRWSAGRVRGEGSELHMILTPLAGAPALRHDGSQSPVGPTHWRLNPEGLLQQVL